MAQTRPSTSSSKRNSKTAGEGTGKGGEGGRDGSDGDTGAKDTADRAMLSEYSWKKTDPEAVLASAVHWLSVKSADKQVWFTIRQIIPTICWPPRQIEELPFDILDRLLVDIRSCFEVNKIGRLIFIPQHREVGLSAISAFLFLVWEKLADNQEKTSNWVRSTDRHADLVNLSGPRYTTLPRDDELYWLGLALTSTIDHLEALVESTTREEQTRRPLRPVVSIRAASSLNISANVLRARTMFYLAQQATPLTDSTNDVTSDQDIANLVSYRKKILDILESTASSAESVPSLAMLTLASAVSVHPRNPDQSPPIQTVPYVCLLLPLLTYS